MLLAGNGPAAEPVRIACACVMVIFVFSLFGGGRISITGISEYRDIIENTIEKENAAAAADTCALAAAGVENMLYGRFGEEVKVEYSLSGKSFLLKRVIYRCAPRKDLAEETAALLGLAPGSVIFSEDF